MNNINYNTDEPKSATKPLCFNVSTFINKFDTEPKLKIVTWEQFCSWIQNPHIRAEKNGAAFSPVVFNGKRAKMNAESVSMLVFDIDHKTDLDTVIEMARKLGVIFAIYSTHSHLRKTNENPNEEPRFRLVIPLAEPIEKDEFESLWLAVSMILNLNIDTSAKDASRLFFSPCKSDENAVYEFVIENDKPFFDARGFLAEFEFQVAQDSYKQTFSDGKTPEWYETLTNMVREIGHQVKGNIEFKCPSCGKNSDSSAVLFDTGAIYCRKTKCKPIEMARALNIEVPHKSNNTSGANASDYSSNSYNSYVRNKNANQQPRVIPVLSEKALIGVPGEVVETIFPHTEADKGNLLIHFLVGSGSLFGRTAYYKADGAPHYTNEYALIIGNTSAAKGSGKSQVYNLLREVTGEVWAKTNKTGLSSAEGLIFAVNDETCENKQLNVTEPEFASVLKQFQRTGNNLSTVLRSLWDDGTAATMVKNNPLSATNAHVSIIGHITPDDLIELRNADIGNGFLNRFLVAYVQRSKDLPDGGCLSDSQWVYLKGMLQKVVEFVEKQGGEFEMTRDDEAKEYWHQLYPRFVEEKPGDFGKVVARAKAHVLRLSMIYALLDRSTVINRAHLEAAFAVWQYCEDSAAYIFGNGSKLSRDAEKLLSALRDTGGIGLTRTDISKNVFRKNRNADKLNAIFAELQNTGLLCFDETKQRWFAVDETNVGTNELNELYELYELNITPLYDDWIIEKAHQLRGYNPKLSMDEALFEAHFIQREEIDFLGSRPMRNLEGYTDKRRFAPLLQLARKIESARLN